MYLHMHPHIFIYKYNETFVYNLNHIHINRILYYIIHYHKLDGNALIDKITYCLFVVDLYSSNIIDKGRLYQIWM